MGTLIGINRSLWWLMFSVHKVKSHAATTLSTIKAFIVNRQMGRRFQIWRFRQEIFPLLPLLPKFPNFALQRLGFFLLNAKQSTRKVSTESGAASLRQWQRISCRIIGGAEHHITDLSVKYARAQDVEFHGHAKQHASSLKIANWYCLPVCSNHGRMLTWCFFHGGAFPQHVFRPVS